MSMNLMVIGGGGREHAIIQKLRESPRVGTIYALPGNGGMEEDAICSPIAAKDLDGIVQFARTHSIDYAVVAPDDPLVLGAVDALEAIGIPCFGPHACAAILEGSKVFAKNLMAKYHIPTARCEIFDDPDQALAYLETAPLPAVVKADGLALGKGVIIAQTREEACAAVRSMMEEKIFGASGSRVVIEEFLTGPEVSVLAFTDGTTVRPMVSSMDHKRAQDGDRGLNTGGMGTIAPNPYYTPEIAQRCMEEIFLPTVRAMKAEGREFRGCLYFGLMLTPTGPKVIEYNCRFGDPETQVVLPLLEGDLLEIMMAVTEGRLDQVNFSVKPGSACCVILAAQGYPVQYQKGLPISIPVEKPADVFFDVAGTVRVNGEQFSSGGRVLGVTAVAPTLREAIDKAYAAVDTVSFPGGFYRRDIGQRALAKK